MDFNGDLKSLKDKVVISSAGSADAKLLEPTLASANMKLDDVKLQLVDINARVPLFLQTPGSFLTGFATGDLLRVRHGFRAQNTFLTRNTAWSPMAQA